MTPDEFRRLALAVAGAVEASHMNHPDFRLGGRIFATLGGLEDGWGMVKLTPEQQQEFMERAPAVFSPCAGAWGVGGSTRVELAAAAPEIVVEAMGLAAGNVVEAARRRGGRR